MSIPRKPITIIAAVVVVALGLIGAAYTMHVGPWSGSDAPDYGRVIARVDGRPIFLELARARVEGLTTVHGSLAETMGQDWQQRILDSLVDDELIREEATRRGIVITQDELQSHVDRLRGQFGSAAEFDAWLSEQGMDTTELERRITLQTLGANVYEAVTSGVDVTIDAIRDYYRTHPNKYLQSDGTRVPLFDVRDQIEQTLSSDAKDAAFGAWLEDQRSSANVVVVDPDWWKELT
jgi:hypothetical protein